MIHKKLNETLLKVKPYLKLNETINGYDYHSTQLDILENSDIKYHIYSLQNQIDSSDLYYENGQFGLETDSHITVCYGLVYETDYFKLRRLVKNFGSIDVQYGAVSKFVSDNYDVIKIDIISDKLHELNSLIRNNFEVKTSFPDYQPHMTIAYVQPNSCDYLLNKPILDVQETFDSMVWSHIDNYKLNIPLI